MVLKEIFIPIHFKNAKNLKLIIILGYIGDRIGYRTVLIIALILSGLSATSFDWTPRFKEFHRIPTITFNSTNGILFSNL